MCGRFALASSPAEIKKLFSTLNSIEYKPNYNICPLTEVPIINTTKEGSRELTFMRWGLIPHWSKDEKLATHMINARAETLDEKPSFKKSFQSKRYIILANGFYEWRKEDKQPYYIKPKEGLFTFACIWDEWKSKNNKIITTFCIITTNANKELGNIHNRMPVIIDKSNIDAWLNPQEELNNLQPLLKSYDEKYIEFWQIDKKVNKPINNDTSLTQKISINEKT
jgi:putative SOS response-associated peptidase YedK